MINQIPLTKNLSDFQLYIMLKFFLVVNGDESKYSKEKI